MERIKFDAALMKFMSLFGAITGTTAKDLIDQGEYLVFVVPEGQIGRAIGRGGINVRKIERALKRKIKIVEFNPAVEQFVRNLVFPLQLDRVARENKSLALVTSDNRTKGKLIGRDKANLRSITSIITRHFDIDEVKVV